MRNFKAVFIKQTVYNTKVPSLIIMAGIFMAFIIVINILFDADDDCGYCTPAVIAVEEVKCDDCLANETHDPSMAGMFTVMFVGMFLVSHAAGNVRDDKTTKNLRFMTMAGVRPPQYVLGTILSLTIFAVPIAILYATVGGYFGMNMFWFVSVAIPSSIISILLGLAMGLAKNPVFIMPVSLLLGFGPMLSTFNDQVGVFLRWTYTQQVRIAVGNLRADIIEYGGNFNAGMSENFMVIGVNAAVVILILIFVTRKGHLD
ncbi:MAG: ABC transporter permease [Defluviitaleaceae bacterium]|nr:ABC transporter permease [Defluviitaleaceae bacterium]